MVNVTGTEAEARPGDDSVRRAVHVPAAFAAVAVTVTTLGVTPEAGLADTKLLQVASETTAVNGDAPAVLRTLIVWIRVPPGIPGPPGPWGPPNPPMNVSVDGFVTRAGADTTVKVTGMRSGLLVTPVVVIVTVPV
jgi:hypothetical protein